MCRGLVTLCACDPAGCGPKPVDGGLLTVAGYFQLFAEPYVMTQGGPAQSTVSLLYFMYQDGFKYWNLGHASATAFILFAVLMGISFVRNRSEEAFA